METIDPPPDNANHLPARVVVIALAALLGLVMFGFLAVKSLALLDSDGGTPQPDVLQLVEGSIPSDLPASVPLRGTVNATFTLESTDSRYVRTLDVYLTDSRTGEPVPGEFTIDSVTSMRFMDHDMFVSAAISSGDGHYRIPLAFSMPGEWQIDLSFNTPSGPASLALFAEIWS